MLVAVPVKQVLKGVHGAAQAKQHSPESEPKWELEDPSVPRAQQPSPGSSPYTNTYMDALDNLTTSTQQLPKVTSPNPSLHPASLINHPMIVARWLTWGADVGASRPT